LKESVEILEKKLLSGLCDTHDTGLSDDEKNDEVVPPVMDWRRTENDEREFLKVVNKGDKSTRTEHKFINNEVELFSLTKKDGSVDELVDEVPGAIGAITASIALNVKAHNRQSLCVDVATGPSSLLGRKSDTLGSLILSKRLASKNAHAERDGNTSTAFFRDWSEEEGNPMFTMKSGITEKALCESNEFLERVLDGSGKFEHTKDNTLGSEVIYDTSKTKASIHETEPRGSMVTKNSRPLRKKAGEKMNDIMNKRNTTKADVAQGATNMSAKSLVTNIGDSDVCTSSAGNGRLARNDNGVPYGSPKMNVAEDESLPDDINGEMRACKNTIRQSGSEHSSTKNDCCRHGVEKNFSTSSKKQNPDSQCVQYIHRQEFDRDLSEDPGINSSTDILGGVYSKIEAAGFRVKFCRIGKNRYEKHPITPKLMVEFRSLSSAEEFLLVLQKYDTTEDGETAALMEFIENKGGIKKSKNVIVHSSGKFDFRNFKMGMDGIKRSTSSSSGINFESHSRLKSPNVASRHVTLARTSTISKSQSGPTKRNQYSRRRRKGDEVIDISDVSFREKVGKEPTESSLDNFFPHEKRAPVRNKSMGPGWNVRNVTFSNGSKTKYWVSPKLQFELRCHKYAMRFESIVRECNGDEFEALKNYSRELADAGIKRWDRIRIPPKYTRLLQKLKPPKPGTGMGRFGNVTNEHDHMLPGPEWSCAREESEGMTHTYWSSPQLLIKFKLLLAAVEFEKIRLEYDKDEIKAWSRFKEEMTNRGVVLSDYVENPYQYQFKHSTSVPDRNLFPSNTLRSSELAINDDVCFICDDGGELIQCDHCTKSYHLGCHIPVLHEVPNKKNWQCCECRALKMKRKQRCGQCDGCKRPNCGECSYCRDKKVFGGSGKFGKACKLRKCGQMRYASSETVPIKHPREGSIGDQVIRKQPVGTWNRGKENKRKIKIMPLRSEFGKNIKLRRRAGSGSQCKLLHCENEMDQMHHCDRPGLGWTFQREKFRSGVICTRWLSPEHQIKFKFRGAAKKFEQLRQQHGDEFAALKVFAKIAIANRRKISYYVANTKQYKLDSLTQRNVNLCRTDLKQPIRAWSRKRKTSVLCNGGHKKSKLAASNEKSFQGGRALEKLWSKTQSKGVQSKGTEEKRPPKRAGSTFKKSKPCKQSRIQTVEDPFKAVVPSSYDDNDPQYVRKRVTSVKPSFLGTVFKGRVLFVEDALNKTPPQKIFVEEGVRYELISAKVPRKAKGGRFSFDNKNNNEIKLLYVATQGPGLKKICLFKEMEKLCAFSSMKSSSKIVARLDHLQAEAKKIEHISADLIEIIEDRGHEGCGYFPDSFFDGWGLGTHCDSVQVRIVAPRLGLIKGMLCKKGGIAKIQIPDSMIKVPPSEVCDHDYATVIVKNSFPSDENVCLGSSLDPNKNARNSWKEGEKKKLSDMYCRMLLGFGVPKKLLKNYKSRSITATSVKHGHLKGLADPTGKIPEGKCFIPGYAKNTNGRRELFGKCFPKVYVSRSPCLAPSDAKLLSVVGTKPPTMSANEWDELCSFEFGSIIFGHPEKYAPLPCMIADGDLDGDDYFVMWDEKIVGHLSSARDKHTKNARKDLLNIEIPRSACNAHKKTRRSKCSDPKWLSKAQDHMLDFERQHAGKNIVGKLYRLCFDASKREDGTYDIYDEDARAYAKAYNDSLDLQKHGGKINLPKHLHENIPAGCQSLLG